MPFPELAYVHIHLGAVGCLKFAPRYKINPAFCHCESVLGALSSGLRAPGSARKRKGQAMNTKTVRNSMAFVAGGALVGGAVAIATASPSWAAPVISSTAAVRTAASNQVTDVHYYHRGYYRHPYYRDPYYGLRYYRRGYGYPWWYNPYSYYNPYYYYYYYYSYPYSYPFSFGF